MKDRYIPGINELWNSPVGYRIKYYRLKSNLTQKQLALKCGLSESAIRNYELNNRKPKEKTLEAIADALNISYWALSDPDLSHVPSALHTLFALGILYDLQPQIIDGEVHLVFPNTYANVIPPYGSFIANMAADWAEKTEALLADSIDLETYLDWQAKYPEKTE